MGPRTFPEVTTAPDADAILAALDPEQREVARHPLGPMGVIAGAGTGKTRAITHRIAYGVRSGAYSGPHVLALTFKALAELRREMGEAGKRNAGRRIKAYFALDTAPFRMALRGVKLWLYAELDGVRLSLKKLLRGKPAAAAPPMPAPATEDR